jgi:putative endopeptidase
MFKRILCFCFSIVSLASAQKEYGIGIDLSIMDRLTDPRQDFSRFATGKWYDNTEIPPSEAYWGSFSEIRNRNEKNLDQILQEIAKDNSLQVNSEKMKIKNLWISSMDSTGRNKSGIKTLLKDLAQITSAKTKQDLIRICATHHRNGAGTLFSFYAYIDMKDSRRNRPYLSQGGLGLPSKEFYLSPNYAEIQKLYTEHIRRTFLLMGVSDKKAEEDSKIVFEIEKQLALGSMDNIELRDAEKQYNKMAYSSIRKSYPNINLSPYFIALGIKTPDTIIVQQPDFYKHLSRLLDSIPLVNWKTYMKWYYVHELQPYLSDDFVNENFSFYGRVLTGKTELQPRWKRAIAIVDLAMGEAMGKLFVEKHFNAEAKKRVNVMVDNLIAAFKDRISTREWMSASTKKAAIFKLDKIVRKLGFPDEWKDYSAMKITSSPLVTNMISVYNWKMQDMLSDLNKAPDKKKWGMSPPTVNAYYNPSTNEIAFPAGIMQPPFFDPSADDAFNYGIMGAVIGHELTHGFDDEGSKFDAEGNLVTWWAEEDISRFEALTLPLVKQFDGYVAIDTFHVKGRLTLGENIADLGGLTMAYYAYKKSLGGSKSEVREGFTGEQRFFLAWAQGWRTKMRDNYLKQMVATNPHSPANFRAMGPPSNMPEFYEAFGVREGDAMYRKKESRVEIW